MRMPHPPTRGARDARVLSGSQRLSSAQSFLGSGHSVNVSFRGGFDFEEASKSAQRAANLLALKKRLFNDSLALLANKAQVLPERLAMMLDLDLMISSEVAEHIEKSMGLPAGWLDGKRAEMSEQEVQALREALEHSGKDEHATESQEEARSISARKPEADEPKPEGIDLKTDTEEGEATMPQEKVETASAAQSLSDESHAAGSASSSLQAQALAWLNEQMKDKPRGSRSQLARLMQRNPNDLSAWLNGLRSMPASAMPSLMQALQAFDAQLAQNFELRLGQKSAQEPASAGTPPQAQQPAEAASEAPARNEAQAASAPAAPSVAAPRVVKQSKVGAGTYVSFRADKNASADQEMRLLALRAVHTLSEVLNAVVHDEEKTES